MSKASNFFNGSSGGPEIGSIILTAQRVTENGLSLLECDGSAYLGNEYPLLGQALLPEYKEEEVVWSEPELTETINDITWKTDMSIAWGWKFNSSSVKNELHTSTDGVSWTKLHDISLDNGNRINPIEIGQATGLMFGTYSFNLYRSTDLGITWQQVSISSRPNGYVLGMAIYKDELKITCQISNADSITGGGYSYSNDGGLTFSNFVANPRFGYGITYTKDGSGIYTTGNNSNTYHDIYRFAHGSNSAQTLVRETYGHSTTRVGITEHSTGEMYLVTTLGVYKNDSASQPIGGWYQIATAPNFGTYQQVLSDELKYMSISNSGTLAFPTAQGIMSKSVTDTQWQLGHGNSEYDQQLTKLSSKPVDDVLAFSAVFEGSRYSYSALQDNLLMPYRIVLPNVTTNDSYYITFDDKTLYKIVGDPV
jgi:hypothetical protein